MIGKMLGLRMKQRGYCWRKVESFCCSKRKRGTEVRKRKKGRFLSDQGDGHGVESRRTPLLQIRNRYLDIEQQEEKRGAFNVV